MAKKNEAEMTETSSSGFSINNFYQGTKEELAKVVWPSRQQLVSESAAVLLMVTLSASLIYLIDGLFNKLSEIVFTPASPAPAAFINVIHGLFAFIATQVL